MPTRPPVAALVIFDGWGISKSGASNAIAAAKTPVMDRLYATQAHTELAASGEAVGLPPGVMGNSEVGHLTIGAGRVIYQDLMRITKAIGSGAFARNPAIVDAIEKTVANGTTLHIWGLLSDGSVHSHIDHLMALLDAAAANGATRIAVHAVLDGRDKPPRSAHRVYRSARSEAEAARMRANRDGHGAILRDGSRQAMGASGAGVARDRRGRRCGGVKRARGGGEFVRRRQER